MPTVEQIHRRLDAAAGDDPREALIAVRKLLNEDIPSLERRAVQLARLELWSWARISRLLARSRQAVRQRFEGVERLPAPSFESDDQQAALDAAAEMWLQRFRRAQAARLASVADADADTDQPSQPPEARALPS